MKTLVLVLGLVFTLNTAYAEMIPNLDCTGTAHSKSIQLEYRDGGAAFMNVYYGSSSEVTFIAVLNASNPVADKTSLPVTLIVGEKDQTLADKNIILNTNGLEKSLTVKLEDGTEANLSCSRLPAISL